MTLSHDVAGSGPTVLLIHSTAADRRMWDPQWAPLLAAGFRVVRCDLRGYGGSPMPDRPWNDALDALDLLDELGVADAAVVGSSGGGRVALEVAGRSPQRVTALALLCSALAGHRPSAELRAFGERENELLEAGDVDAATRLNVDVWVGPQAADGVREKVYEMQRHSFEVQLAPAPDVEPIRATADVAAITARSLVVAGAHDLPDFREIATDLAGRLPGARLLELDWAGHLPSLERPDLLNPILLDFLTEGRSAL